MQKTQSQLFIDLLESIINESSSTIDLVRGNPKGEQLIKYLHKEGELQHDVEYEKIDKISWKDITQESWVIIVGKNSVAAIKVQKARYGSSRSYEARVVDTEGDILTKSDSSGPVILSWIKQWVGRISAYYINRLALSPLRDIKAARQTLKLTPQNYVSTEDFTNQMMKRLKPLWQKALLAAHSDIKGFIGIQLKSNALHKADQKLKRLMEIDNILKVIEDDPKGSYNRVEDYPQSIKNAIVDAIHMAAHYYYPDVSGGFEASRGYQRTTHVVRNREAIKNLFDDIKNGKTACLSTIISFFKRSLMAG